MFPYNSSKKYSWNEVTISLSELSLSKSMKSDSNVIIVTGFLCSLKIMQGELSLILIYL